VRFEDLLRQLEALEPGRLEVIVQRIDEKLKEGVQSNGQLGRVTYPKLARGMMFYALSIADRARSKKELKSNYNAPRWATVADQINSFAESLGGKLGRLTTRTYSADKIAQFATLASRRRGAIDQFFYSTILLFILRLHADGHFDTEFFRAIAPREEHHLPSDIMQVFEAALELPIDTEIDVGQTEANVRFNVQDREMRKLSDFFDQFTFGLDQMLHAVIYRPRRSNPKELMKTFLAISPPGVRSGRDVEYDSYTFAHFYRPPYQGQNDRFSGGKVIPLEGGVYLIGGQRRDRLGIVRYPFESIKIIALRWFDLHNFHQLLPAVVMSTNYQGEMFVSRAAVRLTAIAHSQDADLRAVPLANLEQDIATDLEREQQIIGNLQEEELQAAAFRNRDRYIVEDPVLLAREIAGKIATLTNNDPNALNGWDVPDGCARKTGRKTERLNKVRFEGLIDDALRGAGGEPYQMDGEQFEIFRDLRFGPLTLK
jgi:hypothetical protein